MIDLIANLVNGLSSVAAHYLSDFMKSAWGEIILLVPLFGPISFLPQVWQAWRAPNIDALRTWTWSAMIFVNLAVWISLSVNPNDWQVRLSMIFWVLEMFLVWLATKVRRSAPKET